MQTALVTGGANRIGAAICEHLALHGYQVIIHYHQNHQQAINLQGKLNNSYQTNAWVLQADLSSPTQAEGMFSNALNLIEKPITLLVNNAAIFQPQSWGVMDSDNWHKHLQINTIAPSILAQHFYNQFVEVTNANHGQIINIIDQRVVNLTSFAPAYTASKAALWAMTQSMAMAFTPRVRVNAIAPGLTLPLPNESDATFAQRWHSKPMGYGGKIEDILNAVTFLEKSSSVTGEIILVDGGEHFVRPQHP